MFEKVKHWRHQIITIHSIVILSYYAEKENSRKYTDYQALKLTVCLTQKNKLSEYLQFYCQVNLVGSNWHVYTEWTSATCHLNPNVSSGNTWPHESGWLFLISAVCLSFLSVNRPLYTAWHVAPWPCLLVITGALSRPSQEKRDRGTQQRKLPREAWLTHTIIISSKGYTFQAGWNFSPCRSVFRLHTQSSLQ